jgi:nicotinamidase-related amidase
MISPCIFIDIDTQNDFFDPKGAMPIKGAEEIRGNLKRLTQHAIKRKIKIFAGAQSYDPVEKSKNARFCVAGTKGQKKIIETSVPNACILANEKSAANYETLLKKCRQIVLENENFKFFKNPHTLKLLKKAGVRNCVIYGAAIDYGIEQVALELIKNNFRVWVPVDAVKPINEANREPVMKELRKQGVEMWNTEFIIANT